MTRDSYPFQFMLPIRRRTAAMCLFEPTELDWTYIMQDTATKRMTDAFKTAARPTASELCIIRFRAATKDGRHAYEHQV